MPSERFSFTDTGFVAPVMGLVLACIIWLASIAGLFSVPDGMLYDRIIHGVDLSSDGQPKVLLLEVEADLREAEDALWLKLLDEIEAQGAAQVIFTFMPVAASASFYKAIDQAGRKVIFAQRLITNAAALSPFAKLEPLPEAAVGVDLKRAVKAISPSEYGVYRQQAYLFSGHGDAALVSLEAMAAGLDQHQAEQKPYLVNFMGSATGLPHISVKRVLNGELIPELVQGRVVLIGMADASEGLFTPLAISGRLLSELEFHGYALDTLLSERTVYVVPLWLELPLILLITALSLFACQWGGTRISAVVMVGMFIGYALLTWGVLHLFRIWLPLGELWFSQLLTLLIFTRYRAIKEKLHIQSQLRESNAEMREYFAPSGASSSDEHWSKVIIMVNQTLNLRRMIFFERVKGDHRIREVKSLNCSLDDIKEFRRDFERTPYSTAIAENRPIEVENYLTSGDEDEVQYLVPLLFAGEVMGFWAFSARREKFTLVHNRSTVLRDFAEQIAALLFHHQQSLDKQLMMASPLQRYLRFQGGEQISEMLERTLTSMHHRVVGMEDYLDGLSTAGILYDLFGQVRIANRKMEQVLSGAKMDPTKMTAVDLISAVGQVSLIYARELMETIILHRERISLPAKVMDDHCSYVLQLGPLLSVREQNLSHHDEHKPFEMEGVLCELIDVTALKRMSRLKEDVAEHMTYQVRNDTESLLTGLALLDNKGFPEEKRERVVHIIRDKINNLVSVTERAHALLNVELDTTGMVERYPIDCKEPVVDAVEAMRSKSALYGITYELNLPELISLVFASPDGFRAVLASILAVLVSDAVQQSCIKIQLEERDGWIIYRFANHGFGIPEERFQTYLHGDHELATEEFKKIRHSSIQVEQWDGRLDGHSELGVGIRLELKLRGFV
ncbi:MAG: CHASE2 domain-containing protein [Mariprofundus sp.]|nr:CHASE2 domain-containing protein [Mariprofundus sp.]